MRVRGEGWAIGLGVWSLLNIMTTLIKVEKIESRNEGNGLNRNLEVVKGSE